jgi:glycine oxidase
MTTQTHSVVLGAGLMGRLLAHSLARLGHRVEVYEAQGLRCTRCKPSRVAAAMLAPLGRVGHH